MSRKDANENFIQPSTRKCVEWTFGILKGRWRLVSLRNVPYIEIRVNYYIIYVLGTMKV